MAEDTPAPETTEQPASAGAPLWRRIILWTGAGLVGLVVLVGAMLLFLNTTPGKRFLIGQIAALEMESGMKIGIGRIEGSIYSRMTIRDLTLSDPKGVFASSPEVTVDWSPFRYINSHIMAREVTSPLVTLARGPEFKPTQSDPNAPILPDLDIDIDRLRIDRFVLNRPVIGEQRVLSIDASTHIADGRAQLRSNVRADSGDRLAAFLDAVPAQDRLEMKGQLDAPAGGVVARMSGLTDTMTATLDGKGLSLIHI